MTVVTSTLLLPATATAHLRSGTIAVDYRARVIRPRASPEAAFTVSIYASDRALRLSVGHGHTVVVLGYLGEPFIRIDATGVAVNDASSTAASARLVKTGRHASGGRPAWTLKTGRHSISWHDARVEGLPPGVDHGSWSVPLLLDRRRSEIRGETWRLRGPALWPWLTLVLVFLAATILISLPRRAHVLRNGSIVFGSIAGVAAAATMIGFAVDPYASPGTLIAGVDGLIFAAVGFLVLAWGPPKAHVGAAIWLGGVALAVGFSAGPVFLHALVLSAFPGIAARLLAAVAIGAGLAATALGGLLYASHSIEDSLAGRR